MPATHRRVSVIIPCHNHAAYLGECLASVAGQTRPADEVIVVDDGSTDGSAEIAAGHAAAVTLIRQARGGIASARNAGLRAASGDAIAFLDSDDIWPVDSLALRLERLQREPAVEVVFGQVEQFHSPDLDADTRARLHCPPGRQSARLAGTLLIDRSTLDRVGHFDVDIAMGETMDWVARLAADGAPVAAVEALTLRRRIHGHNTVLKHSPAEYLRVLHRSLHRPSRQPA